MLLFVLLSLAGCGAAHKDAAMSGGYPGMAPEPPAAPAESVQAEQTADSDEAASRPPEPMPASAGATAAGPPPVQAPMPAAKAAPARMRDEAQARDKPAERATGTSGGQASTPVAPQQKPAVASQMLVYTANLHVRVQEVPKAIDAVERMAKQRGGYLVERQDNRITVRVPSARFDAALDELVKLGDLVHRNVSIEDVTDLYFDMQTRMKNLEVVKKRLEELLEKAKTVEESLAVQRQLERVSGELERLRGKLKLLAELVMFSTITVVFEPKSTETIDSKVRLPFPWMDRLGLGELLRL